MQAFVVDDSHAMRRLESSVLQIVGFDVIECGSADHVADALRSGAEPRVVLLDWNMPATDCLEVVRDLRERFDRERVFIMMVTAETDFQYIEAALAAGADEYLMKPFDIPCLMSKLVAGGIVSPDSIPTRFSDDSGEVSHVSACD